MPWTFAHAAAALPFRRLCPKYLSFPALAIGAMAPDFGYYVGQFRAAAFAHTFAGSLVVSLPSGLLVLAALRAIREPVCHLLPRPHREAISRLTEPLSFTALRAAIVSWSIVVGAWTHIAWDAFTHASRWGARNVEFIRDPLFQLGTFTVHGYMLLQQLSTILGTALLVGAYVAWLRKHRAPPSAPGDEERKRWWLIAATVLVTLAIALPLAWSVAVHDSGYFAFGSFVFHSAVYSAAVFFPVFVGTALYYSSGKPADQGHAGPADPG